MSKPALTGTWQWVAELEEQLAAVTAERDELKRRVFENAQVLDALLRSLEVARRTKVRTTYQQTKPPPTKERKWQKAGPKHRRTSVSRPQ